MSPLHRVGAQIQEALELHDNLTGEAAKARVIDMLRLVRFPDPERGYKSYPFELSGGLRQRAMIAMALVCNPALLIADEPTTALDVTVQAQVLGLIKDLQRELGMSVLMITHDMGVVANVADEVVVLYRGEVMESGTAEAIFRNPPSRVSEGAHGRRAEDRCRSGPQAYATGEPGRYPQGRLDEAEAARESQRAGSSPPSTTSSRATPSMRRASV